MQEVCLEREYGSKEETGEHSMMMLAPKVTKDGTMVYCALHVKIVTHNRKCPRWQQPWNMDYGATGHMSAYAHLFMKSADQMSHEC